MSEGSCTCPQAIRAANNRRNLKSIWRSQAWRDESTAFKARHPHKCVRCGTEGPIVPGHAPEDYYPGMEAAYIQKVREDHVEALCPRCNRNESKGRHPCPSCIRKHQEDPEHWIRYIPQGQESCGFCQRGGAPYLPPRRRTRSRHPCSRRIGQQRCLRDGRTYICARSAKEAEGCDYFRARRATA